jgi:hypothetical protein
METPIKFSKFTFNCPFMNYNNQNEENQTAEFSSVTFYFEGQKASRVLHCQINVPSK